MDDSRICAKVEAVVGDVLGIDVRQIGDETSFEDLQGDSLSRLEIGVDVDYTLQRVRRNLAS